VIAEGDIFGAFNGEAAGDGCLYGAPKLRGFSGIGLCRAASLKWDRISLRMTPLALRLA
jgi:hypothetical protein